MTLLGNLWPRRGNPPAKDVHRARPLLHCVHLRANTLVLIPSSMMTSAKNPHHNI